MKALDFIELKNSISDTQKINFINDALNRHISFWDGLRKEYEF